MWEHGYMKKPEKFIEKLVNLSENDFKILEEYGEILTWFMASSNEEYIYNETYISEYFDELEMFIKNIKMRKTYIDDFVEILLKNSMEYSKVIIEFDKYIKYELAYPDYKKCNYENKIPEELLKENNDDIYICCKMKENSGVYNTYVSEYNVNYTDKDTKEIRIKTKNDIEDDFNDLIKKGQRK